MKEKKQCKPIQTILVIYLICFIFRTIEYMLIRTDQSILGEAFIHKLVGILVMILAAKHFSLTMKDIGFANVQAGKNILYGLFLGIAVFILAYGVEVWLQISKSNFQSLRLYVSSYAVDGNRGNQVALWFFAICIIGNIINVVMEEGVFRGLFLKLTEKKYSFVKAAFITSVLFGIWHIAGPVRSFWDGDISATGAIMSAVMLVVTSGLVGFKFCLLTKITGSLWMAMADHFVNNTIVNILHVVTSTGADELIMVRITVAQAVSFLIVLFVYWKSDVRYKQAFRAKV
ncbi:type II CAAX endopeptidase family protein [Hydrogenoanaerobacterium sp.]|uniref:CPBP family intramembrane glutamic endopeptidase n=1 Tax=Hydrogenoanaerobacterium sp. TaxID=2953763 RepID=UPI00289C0B2E|nr:type II CAAX endopeptidase family protein [Hydrogenoanaerobacterium sp.]